MENRAISTNQPDTRPSLLLRIQNSQDRDAWSEFASIYRPAIIRLAKTKGLQNADAEDLAQQVLMAVSQAIQNWQHDSSRARFWTWLSRVTYNAVINLISRARPDRPIGNSNIIQLLRDYPANTSAGSDLLLLEIRREVFRFAARQIRCEFHDDTWQAFWESAVVGKPIKQVAKDLDKNCGAVYAARSRIMCRLKEKIDELQLLDPMLENCHD